MYSLPQTFTGELWPPPQSPDTASAAGSSRARERKKERGRTQASQAASPPITQDASQAEAQPWLPSLTDKPTWERVRDSLAADTPLLDYVRGFQERGYWGGASGGTQRASTLANNNITQEIPQEQGQPTQAPDVEWSGKTLVRFSERKDEKTTAQRVGELLGSHAYSGIAGFNKALAQTADFFLPDEWLGESNAVSALFDDYRRRGDDAAEQAARVREGFGSAGRIAGNVTEATVQALPGALLALLTAGGSAAAQTTSGLQAATTAAASSGLVQTLSASMQTMLKNPMFWLAFSQSAGKNYEEAKARGAGELSAQTSAILSSLLTSGVEIGGGLETLPAELIDGASVPAVQKWVRSMLEEGREEVVQGVVEQLTAKLLYDADKPYLSASDLDAVLNPLRSAQEFGIGAAVGGILGGGQLGAATLINRTQADAPLLDYIRGFQESGDLDGAGRHMQNKSAVGLDLASAEVKAAALDTPLTQSLSSGEISGRITNLLGALEEADTAIAVRPNGITDTQLSLLLDRLYDATSLRSQFPGALSRSLKEVEDGLLDFRIAREWDTALDGGYSTAAQRKAWGVLMRRLSSGPLPDLVKWIDNGGNTAEQYSLLEQVGPVGYDSFGQAKDTQTDSQIESIWDDYEQKNSPLTEGAGDFIDGIKITNDKVGGKIPIDEFKTIRQSSIKNPDADSMTLGKFTDDATSYTQRAGTNSSYFDLGSEWGSIKQRYGLNNNEMFDYLNKSALDDAISKGKTIRFSHNPLDYGGSFLADEWEYLKETLNLTDANLVYDGGFWYVR